MLNRRPAGQIQPLAPCHPDPGAPCRSENLGMGSGGTAPVLPNLGPMGSPTGWRAGHCMLDWVLKVIQSLISICEAKWQQGLGLTCGAG